LTPIVLEGRLRASLDLIRFGVEGEHMNAMITTLLFALLLAWPDYARATVYVSTDVPKPIPDVAATDSTLSVPDLVFPGDVNVTINLTHTFVADLHISLISPSSISVDLVRNRGGAGDNFTNTTFDDSAATSIATAGAPFTGTFRPEEPLSGFNGAIAQGVWTLHVADEAAIDVGTLLGWSLDITPGAAVPEPSILALCIGGLIAVTIGALKRS